MYIVSQGIFYDKFSPRLLENKKLREFLIKISEWDTVEGLSKQEVWNEKDIGVGTLLDMTLNLKNMFSQTFQNLLRIL